MLWQFRRELISELLKHGEVVISTPFVGHEEDLAMLGCRLIETDFNRRSINPIADMRLYRVYEKILKTEKPDMVITYSIKPNVYAGYACQRLDIPYSVNVQGLGTAFEKQPIATVATVMYKMALRKAHTVFFENAVNAEAFEQKGIIKAEKETILNGAGVNLDYYKLQPYPSEKDGIHFLYLGRIMKEKGIDELFDVAKRLKEKYGDKVVFDMVGFFEDEYKDIVEKLAEEGIINFHGFQSESRPFYEKSHCVVLPSYHEGMSNVLLEAAATGRAIITTDIPGCREAVKEGENGFLCKKMDNDSLYKCMEKFIFMTSDERKKMGLNGRKKMEEEFDKEKVVNRTMDKIMYK
jgi:galacturonosyltransferase